MSIFKKLSNLFAPSAPTEGWTYWVYVQCNRCGEKLRARIDLRNELSIEYGENEAVASYYCHKTLIGEKRCYQPIEVDLMFDPSKKLTEQKITGGKFISAEEYEATGEVAGP
jgi:hypothetical protein